MDRLNKPLVSICITSYNRVIELHRCLMSIDSQKYAGSIEIVVSEDNSPRRQLIKQMLDQFVENSHYKIRVNYNTNNLGYDRNLGKLISLADGEYILLMSDDDSFISNALDVYIDELLSNNPSMAFSPFVCDEILVNRKYANSFNIEPSEKHASEFIYDSILFSGLTFKRDSIQNLDSEPFLNTYYFQVYLFLSVIYTSGGRYINAPLIKCNGDGENGFGLSESSIKQVDLADRNSVYSKLEFHKGLIYVIKCFDEKYSTNILSLFAKEYSLHSFTGMSDAKRLGYSVYKEYLRRLDALNIKLSPINKIYRIMISLFGVRVSCCLINIPKRILVAYRRRK